MCMRTETLRGYRTVMDVMPATGAILSEAKEACVRPWLLRFAQDDYSRVHTGDWC